MLLTCLKPNHSQAAVTGSPEVIWGREKLLIFHFKGKKRKRNWWVGFLCSEKFVLTKLKCILSAESLTTCSLGWGTEMHCKSHQCKNDPRGLPEVREAQVEWLVGSVQAGQEHAARRRKTLPGNSRRYGHTLSQNQIRDPFLDEGFLALNAAD